MDRTLKRVAFLEKAALLPLLAVVLDEAAQAQSSKSSKDSMHYQSTPNNGMQCSGCKFFMPGKDADADGSCQIVEGGISPHGFCIAYSAKS
ncbi:MAG: high-potential iron-sulfur protein [Candidatus Eremiobacteraeota bacterium]|nr:high-potential iron-sulfur protein [Candidatus Eremiobacteraeota bacterium]MBV8434685.1 high-potential iron-sulfur protein [Candidatus Eremiobacteraeota bacterium]MBV8583430.1 high-potential iron-sulfur protein [Candidatus Eremiobacteraeota bacterium]MBV8654532.1 high-potential iron-sulfur protein [Candidatus Eremiobacteraeota bacterium]MBV8721876.1 high-potential iron-sulfur protein [Candidatus Eremiobacteraeota bacterium]